jgi:hypothetical protein
MILKTQELVNKMTAELEAYDLSATCGHLSDSIDDLTKSVQGIYLSPKVLPEQKKVIEAFGFAAGTDQGKAWVAGFFAEVRK